MHIAGGERSTQREKLVLGTSGGNKLGASKSQRKATVVGETFIRAGPAGGKVGKGGGLLGAWEALGKLRSKCDGSSQEDYEQETHPLGCVLFMKFQGAGNLKSDRAYVYKNHFTGTQPHSLIYIELLAASAKVQWRSCLRPPGLSSARVSEGPVYNVNLTMPSLPPSHLQVKFMVLFMASKSFVMWLQPHCLLSTL